MASESRLSWALVLVSVAVVGSLRAQTAAPRPVLDDRKDQTALVVLIAIDQMRPDYFDRFGAQLSGGLGRIRARSAFFPHGLQDHANTETAPGHSTMLSGREPTHTGIVSNDRGVSDRTAPLIDATGEGASPRRFLGTTLFDWMRAADSGARVLSVSRKDRGAILPVGRARGAVYWWADGAFTTSKYYRDTLPAWVTAFNARRGIDALAGTEWTLLLPASSYAEPDTMPFEHGGTDVAFPHALPSTAAAVRKQLANYPQMDSLTLAFALDGVQALALGQRGHTDLLSISLSTTDAIGHAYGPDSREIHDQILRLDRWLGVFLDSLAKEVPPDRMVLALTSDHGVTSFPEYLAMRHQGHPGRVSLDQVTRTLTKAFGPNLAVDFDFDASNGLVIADTTALRARGVDVDSLSRATARMIASIPGVARVYTPSSLAAAPANDSDAVRWRRAVPISVMWLACAVAAPGVVWSDGSLKAEHGTMSLVDMTVPIAFMGRGIMPRALSSTARSVDIAPTLAAYLGIRPMEALDGHVLTAVLGGAPTTFLTHR